MNETGRSGKAPTAATPPPDGFALVVVGRSPGCLRCTGLTRIEVRTPGGAIGYLQGEYPWEAEVPEDLAQHPTHPHYPVDYYAEDVNGAPLSVDTTSLHFAAVQMLALARSGAIDTQGTR